MEVRYELMEPCPYFNASDWGRQQVYRNWLEKPLKKRGPKPDCWDPEREPCSYCGLPEPTHGQHGSDSEGKRMTAEGEKLAEFLKHFYGLEPIKPAQTGGRG